MFSDPVFLISVALGVAVLAVWFFLHRSHRRGKLDALPGAEVDNVEAGSVAWMPDAEVAPAAEDDGAPIEFALVSVATDEAKVAEDAVESVLPEPMETEEIVEAVESESDLELVETLREKEDVSQMKEETGAALEDFSTVEESTVVVPALASAARAAVPQRSRVVEKPALAPEIDDQISAIDHRLNELERLIDSIERCLAGFEPLRESSEEERRAIPEAA